MEIINGTKMAAGYTLGMEPSGRQSIVVIVKGTFTIPGPEDEVPKLAAEQDPLIVTDEFSGEPGFSAPVREVDFAPTKPQCDVLLNGAAYAPHGKPVQRIGVSFRVGNLGKSFDVVGNRVWHHGLLGTSPTAPEPFIVMPFSYNNAFGGTDDLHQDPNQHRTFLANHVGVGFHNAPNAASINGKPLPNTEEKRQPVTDPRQRYRPMAFGSLGRAWHPRCKWAGTYDQNWQDNDYPFLPADFDNRYFQAAPVDQQMSYPQGGEEVVIENMSPGGEIRFRLPRIAMPVEFVQADFQSIHIEANLDTICIEPDRSRFTLAWRTSIPLRRDVFELANVVVGRMPRGWYRARSLGKKYYPSLAGLVANKPGSRI